MGIELSISKYGIDFCFSFVPTFLMIIYFFSKPFLGICLFYSSDGVGEYGTYIHINSKSNLKEFCHTLIEILIAALGRKMKMINMSTTIEIDTLFHFFQETKLLLSTRTHKSSLIRFVTHLIHTTPMP